MKPGCLVKLIPKRYWSKFYVADAHDLNLFHFELALVVESLSIDENQWEAQKIYKVCISGYNGTYMIHGGDVVRVVHV